MTYLGNDISISGVPGQTIGHTEVSKSYVFQDCNFELTGGATLQLGSIFENVTDNGLISNCNFSSNSNGEIAILFTQLSIKNNTSFENLLGVNVISGGAVEINIEDANFINSPILLTSNSRMDLNNSRLAYVYGANKELVSMVGGARLSSRSNVYELAENGIACINGTARSLSDNFQTLVKSGFFTSSSFTGTHDIKIANGTFNNMENAISLSSVAGANISNNTISNIQKVAIEVGQMCSGIVIASNTISNVYENLLGAITVTLSTGTVISANKVTDGGANGLFIENCNDIEVRNNVLTNSNCNINYRHSNRGKFYDNQLINAPLINFFSRAGSDSDIQCNEMIRAMEGLTVRDITFRMKMVQNVFDGFSDIGFHLYDETFVASNQYNKGNKWKNVGNIGAKMEGPDESQIQAFLFKVRDLPEEFPTRDPMEWFKEEVPLNEVPAGCDYGNSGSDDDDSDDDGDEFSGNDVAISMLEFIQDDTNEDGERFNTAIPQGEYKKMTNEQWNSFKDSVFTAYQKHLKEIYDKYGFVGFDLAGEDGSRNFWLMVQHSDHNPDFQKGVLEKMKIEVDKENATPSNYGLLVDRVNLNTGNKQIYGTQVI